MNVVWSDFWATEFYLDPFLSYLMLFRAVLVLLNVVYSRFGATECSLELVLCC